MFCEECGAKNKKGATFCEECGHPIKAEVKETKKEKTETKKTTEEPKVETKKTEKVAKKPISKGTKILVGSVAAVVAILVGAYIYLGSVFTPEKIAIKYFKAYANKDADKIYKIVKLDESEFVSKKLLKEALKNDEKIELENYKIEKNPTKTQLEKALGVKVKEDLSKTITIKYVKKGSSKEYYKNITLVKSKHKKFLFFDNWVVDSSDLVANDYTFSVPKDSKPTINGKKVSDKYKKDSYSSYYDSYKIPSILKGTYKLKVTLDSGLTLVGDMKINGSYGTYSSSSLKLEDKTEKKLVKDIKEKLTTIYNGVTENKNFDDIKDAFAEDYRDSIEGSYGTLKQAVLTDYNKLKEFKLTDVKIKYYTISDENLNLTVQVTYDYKTEYKNGDDVKEYSKTGKTSNIYLTYKLDGKEYALSEFRNLIAYFSHYSY